jgi:FtsZ-binding cell division protein ZapB
MSSHRENVRDPLQELTRFDKGATLEADLLLTCDSLTVLQCDILEIKEELDGDFERIRSELENLASKVDRPDEKHSQISEHLSRS